MSALFLTWLILLLCTVLLYIYGKRDFASPSFLLALSFFSTFSVVMFNIKNWDIAIHGFFWMTTLCILTAILSFFLGSTIVAQVSKRENVNEANVHIQIRDRSETYPYGLFCVLSVVLFILFLHYKIGAIDLSSFNDFTAELRKTYSEGKSYSFFTTQILEAFVGLTYISLHRVFVEAFYLKKRVNRTLFLPIVLFLGATLLYTDRNIFLRFMITGLIAFVMAFNWKGISTRNNMRLAITMVVAVIAIAGVFWYYGHLKQYTSNFERMVGIYAGSGIYGFNLWLKEFSGPFTHGEFMFSSVLNMLARFGIGSGTTLTQYFEYITYEAKNGYVFATNIYSALRIYYQDFGIFGIAGVTFGMGMLFEKLYQVAVRNKFGFWWLFYCAHIYHVIYFPILEQFMLRFHLGLVYEIFWLWFFYTLVYGTTNRHIKFYR